MHGLTELRKYVSDFFPKQLLDDIAQNVRNRLNRNPIINKLMPTRKKISKKLLSSLLSMSMLSEDIDDDSSSSSSVQSAKSDNDESNLIICDELDEDEFTENEDDL